MSILVYCESLFFLEGGRWIPESVSHLLYGHNFGGDLVTEINYFGILVVTSTAHRGKILRD